MMALGRKSTLASGGALLATLAVPAVAHAAPCDTSANTVYIAGSSAVKPVLKQLAVTLGGLAQPVRLVYQSVSSCQGLSDVLTSKAETATGVTWDNTGTESSCDVDVSGKVPDIGVSDVYATTCDSVTVPATGFKETLGPIQVMNFVAPPSSKENVISAEAALVVYGFGGQGTVVTPWNDPTAIFQRPDTSGTRRMIGKAIGLDIGKWHAVEKKGSGDVLAAVHAADATNPNGGLGILASDFADTNRSGASAIKILAFQPKGEACAYYPDSSSTTFDKANVRDGKYPIFGPVHFWGKTDATDATKKVLDYVARTGLDAAAKKSMIDAEVAARTVPWCAMRVKRDGEVGTAQVASYQPDEPCGCYFESKATGAASASCKTCNDDSTCGGGKCRYGFCEAR